MQFPSVNYQFSWKLALGDRSCSKSKYRIKWERIEQEYLSLPNDVCFQRCYLARKREWKWLRFFGLEFPLGFPLLFSRTRGFDPQWTRLPRCCLCLWQISETGETEYLTSKWEARQQGSSIKAYIKLSSYSMTATLPFRFNLYEHWSHGGALLLTGSIEPRGETVWLYLCGGRRLSIRISRSFSTWINTTWREKKRRKKKKKDRHQL